VRGDVAWASSLTSVEGELRGRAINSVSAELMVLSREDDGWKIRAIHWSRERGGPRRLMSPTAETLRAEWPESA
jgi:hypothetical protein